MPAHSLSPLLLFVHIELPVKSVHQPYINKDEGNKDIYGALLGKPEAKTEAANADHIQFIYQENSKAVGDHKPYREKNGKVSEVPVPVFYIFLFMRHLVIIQVPEDG